MPNHSAPPIVPLRLLALLLVALGALVPGGAAAQDQNRYGDRDFGLGLIIGDPTGVSMKGWLSAEMAIDGAVGFELIDGNDLSLHADVLWHFPIEQWENAALDLYLGVGPMLGLHDRGPRHDRHDDDHDHDHIHIGARGPFGLAVMFNPARFDVFLEVAAKLWLVDDVRFGLDAAIGGRYWF
jgi:hypothetical protein